MSYDLPPPRAYGTERLSENYPDLLAWVGEDELGSGKIGIKQASCTAGIIPMVAVDEHRHRMDMMTRR